METSWAPYMEWSKARPAAWIDLAGSNLLGCTADDLPGARAALEISGLNPDGYVPLLEAIAAKYGVSAARVATAPGCSGANFLAFAALVRPGDDVLVERPGYDPLLGALRMLGANIRRFERRWEERWAVDPDRIAAAMTPRTRLIVLTSPHNPTGVLIGDGPLDAVGALAARADAHVLVDEVYLDAVYEERPAPAATRGEVFISTNSLTKAYGLSGLRAGWTLAAPAVTRAIRRARDVVDVIAPYPADQLAHLAFQHIHALEARARALVQPNLDRLRGFVSARRELEWVPPGGGTVAFPRLLGVSDTRDFADQLMRDHHVAIVPGHFFDEPSHFRIAFGVAPGTFAAGLAAIDAALDARGTPPD
ncbi:MAG: aminotransferase class I/II-fold pyridoxal phosphate-dependent enzyme [Longimicrobiales bacterium]